MANHGGQELTIDLPALPERVWDALTNPAKLAVWFGENDLAPRAGHRFTVRPRAATGLGGPIHGEVTAVDAPHRLVMRWRTPTGDLIMAWSVDKAAGGTRLSLAQSSVTQSSVAQSSVTQSSVAESSMGGSTRSPEFTYRSLFDEHLRGFLRSGMLGRIQAPPRPARPASLFEPLSDPEPESSPVASFDAVPPARRAWEPRPHRGPQRRWGRRGMAGLLGAGLVVVLAIVLATVILRSPGSIVPWGPPGPQGTPIANDASASGPDATAGDATNASRGANGGPGPVGASPSAGAPASGPAGPSDPTTTAATAPAPMAATYSVAVTPLVGYTVTVSVTNPAPTEQTWQNVKVTLASLDLGVSNVESTVTFQKDGTNVCFTPSAAIATVAPGEASTFGFYVKMLLPSVLGNVTAISLDDPGCPPAG